jgi:hypothetical protein
LSPSGEPSGSSWGNLPVPPDPLPRSASRTGASRPPPRLRVLEALQHRDFRLLWTGQTVSQIGDAAFVVALGWRAFALTHKASSLGIVLMVESFGLVATLLIGGVLADRYSRKLLLIGSDGARALVIAALATVDATGHLTFGILIAFVALHGLGSGLFQPAFGGIVPLLVEEPHLGSANALVGISCQAAFVVGPALAGLIYGVAGSSAISSPPTPRRSSSRRRCSRSHSTRVRARPDGGSPPRADFRLPLRREGALAVDHDPDVLRRAPGRLRRAAGTAAEARRGRVERRGRLLRAAVHPAGRRDGERQRRARPDGPGPPPGDADLHLLRHQQRCSGSRRGSLAPPCSRSDAASASASRSRSGTRC